MSKYGYRQENSELDVYKRKLVKTAKDLCYSSKIIDLIKEATSESEAIRAMMKGREEIPD